MIVEKVTELIDAVERRTLSIDRDRTEEEAIAVQITAVAEALRRLVRYIAGAFTEPDEEIAAINQAEAALEAYDGFPDDFDKTGPR